MAALVVNRDLRERLRFLVKEEEKHRQILEQAYARQFPDVELALPAHSLVPTVESAIEEEVSVPELFQIAMKAEQLSAEFYQDLADRSKEETSRTTLTYLSRMEVGHYNLLKTEFELIQRFPSYYQVDEFHLGEEMIHFGP
jgi:rubrerythrin